MRYYMHIPLPKELRDRVSEIEKKFQGDSRSEPHITLVSPRKILSWKVPHEAARELAGKIHKVVIGMTPFYVIQERHAQYFGEEEHFYIPVRRTDGIVDCHKALVHAAEDILEGPGDSFANMPRPHITLASKVPKERRRAAWAEIRNQGFSGSFLCKKVVLLRLGEGDKKWEVVANFPLGGK